MKKITKEFQNLETSKLERDLESQREDIAKTILSQKSSPAKDTNLLTKKRKRLAVMLTIMSEKKEREVLITKTKVTKINKI